jgi:hypothetical protein
VIRLPVEYSIIPSLNIAYGRWTGHSNLNEFHAMFAAYLEDQNYAMGHIQLCDFSHIEGLDADFNSIWSALSMMNASNISLGFKPQCVIYAPSDVAFGYARIYQSLAEYEDGIQVTVCREEIEAMTSLDLASLTMEELLSHGGFLSPKPNAPIIRKI